MTPVAQAMLIGVPAPQPLLPESSRKFKPLKGVKEDLDWYESTLREAFQSAPESFEVRRYSKPSETSAEYLKSEIERVLMKVPHGGLFVLVVVGHGTEIPDRDGDEAGRPFDQAFVTSDGALTDDFFRDLWAKHPDVNVLTFADVCHADTVLLYREPLLEPDGSPGSVLREIRGDHLDLSGQGDESGRGFIHLKVANEPRQTTIDVKTNVTGPARLMFSACQKDESAWESAVGGRFTNSLAQAWEDPASRTSYRTWFEKASTLVKGQHPSLRFRGPARLWEARPFQVPDGDPPAS